MSDKQDGGQAFPCAGSEHGYPVAGMSLRDYFAAKAMQALIERYGYERSETDNLAECSYDVADSMLAERAK